MRSSHLIMLLIVVCSCGTAQSQDYSHPALKVLDTFSAWSKDGRLTFYTSRNLIINGKEVKEPLIRPDSSDGLTDGLALFDEKVQPAAQLRLLVKMPGVRNPPSWSDTSTISFTDGTKVGIVNLNQSLVVAVNKNRVFRFDASWNSDGKRLVMSGTHSPSDAPADADQDIFVSEIEVAPGRNPVQNTKCIVRWPGIDKLPAYSPQGDWIYFFHQEPLPPFDSLGRQEAFDYYSRKNWGLYRVRVGEVATKQKPPEKIVGDLHLPDRLSFFPNGKKVLVSFENQWRDEAEKGQMAVVDVEKKTMTPYTLKSVKDSDHPSLPPLIPSQVALSPDGKKLAFSALLWSGKDLDDGWICIYICNFDGSNLHRVTPADRSPLPPYDYKNVKLTPANAWDLAFKKF